MAPLNVEIVEIERLHEIHREESQDKKVEQDPWYQESTLPFSHSMTGETVAHSREGSEKSKETTAQHHPFAIFDVVRQSHGDQGDPSNQVADVEEEKAAKERIGCPQDLHRLLAGPQRPQGRAEVPDGLHDVAVSSSNNLLSLSLFTRLTC